MKKNYLYLLIILSIFRATFPMVQTRIPEEIPDLYKEARQSDAEGKVDQALQQYKSIIDINIPAPQSSTWGFILTDPLSTARKLQKEANDAILRLENQVLTKAQELIDQERYDEAEQELGINLITQDSKDKALKLADELVLKMENKLLTRFQRLVAEENYPAAQKMLQTELKSKISNNEFKKQEIYLKSEQEQTKKNQERKEQQLKQQQLERERLEQERLEQAQLEKERLEQERLQKEQLKKKQQLEKIQRDREQFEREQREQKERLEQEAAVEKKRAELELDLATIKNFIKNKNYNAAESRLKRLPAQEKQVIELKEDLLIEPIKDLARNNQYVEAFDKLQPLINKKVAKAIALGKQLQENQLQKAQTFINSNNYTEAAKILDMLAIKRPGSETILKNAMEIKKNIASITTLYNAAQNFERQKNLNDALSTYKKIIIIKIPGVTPGQEDPYQTIRSSYRHAENQVKYLPVKPQLDVISDLIKNKKYTEANEKLGAISLEGRFTEQGIQLAREITEKLKQQKDVEQKQKAAELLTQEQNQKIKKAEELANEGKYQEAYAILTPLYQGPERVIAAKELEDLLIQKQVAKAKEGLSLTKADYGPARAVLNVLRTKRPQEAVLLEHEIKMAETKHTQAINQIASDYQVAQQSEQDGNTADALELYKKIRDIKLPARGISGIVWDSYSNQRDLQQKAGNKVVFLETIKPELTKAEDFARTNNYIEALNVLDNIPAERRTASEVTDTKNRIKNQETTWTNQQLQKARTLINEKHYQQAKGVLDALKTKTALLEAHRLQKQVDKLLQAKAHVGRNYTEAYKLLDELISEGFTEAIAIKKEIEEGQQRIAAAAGGMPPEAALAEVNRLFAEGQYGPAQTILDQLGRQSALSPEINNRITALRTQIDNQQRRLREDATRQEEERRRRLAQDAAERERRTRSAQDLKNAFVRLTTTLRSISSRIGRR